MTSPIERFWPKPDMDVAPDGPFVRYSDYERLSAELARARELFDACAVARDDAGFVGTVPDCIEALDGEVKLATGRAETVETLLATSQRELAEARAELDRALDERDEALQEPWPKWADEIRKCLESYGVDPGDEWDLPEQFEMWIAGVVEAETARAEAAEARATASERQVEAMERERDCLRSGLETLAATFYKEDQHQAYARHVLDEAALQKGNPDA